jgi:hypothetical protein
VNLVDQIFAQAQAGSAQGQGFGQYFAEGVQAGQRQQQLDMQKKQLAVELAQAPLKQTLLQQDAALKALAIEKGLRANQEEIEGNSLVSQYSKAMQGANLLPLDSGIRVHSQFGLDHPAILTNPEYVAAGKQLDARVQQASQEEYRLAIADARAQAAAAAQTRAEAYKMKSEYDAKGKAEALPRLVQVGGRDYIVNSKTGHFEPADKTETKSAFISKHLLNFSKDNMVDPKEAAARLGELYDSMIAPLGKAGALPAAPGAPAIATPPPAASAALKSLKPGARVQQNGVWYIYRGGDPMDPASYVPER